MHEVCSSELVLASTRQNCVAGGENFASTHSVEHAYVHMYVQHYFSLKCSTVHHTLQVKYWFVIVDFFFFFLQIESLKLNKYGDILS